MEHGGLRQQPQHLLPIENIHPKAKTTTAIYWTALLSYSQGILIIGWPATCLLKLYETTHPSFLLHVPPYLTLGHPISTLTNIPLQIYTQINREGGREGREGGREGETHLSPIFWDGSKRWEDVLTEIHHKLSSFTASLERGREGGREGGRERGREGYRIIHQKCKKGKVEGADLAELESLFETGYKPVHTLSVLYLM